MAVGTRDGKRSFSDQKYGVKTFYEPPNAILDIVFVHGITGHRDHTWSAGNGKPWPATLLPPKIPDARVLSFGYDATVISWRSSISNNNIGDHAKNLLVTLTSRREADSTSDRPIIFVAHSLGGVVCKDALLSSRANPENYLQNIYQRTSAILFLGTPHSGTGLATVAKGLAQLISLITRTNLQVIKVLQRDSEVLARIRHEFHSLLRSRIPDGHQEIDITCFYEEVPLWTLGEVVPKCSAILPGYTAIGIHRNHRDMARFVTEHDQGFISIVDELQRLVKNVLLPKYKVERAGVNAVSKSTGNLDSVAVSNNNLEGITIWGDVVKSNIVNGNQNIYCGLTFS